MVSSSIQPKTQPWLSLLIAGKYATELFGVGLLGASLLAAGILPLSTTYMLSESLGFERGVSRSWQEAPVFMGYLLY
jgi:Mn2+/Fe2+ NRAMP family transporter